MYEVSFSYYKYFNWNQNAEQILLGNYKIFIDNILLFVINNNNINIKYIITRRCQGSTPFKKKQFKYATFDYRKFTSVEARMLP